MANKAKREQQKKDWQDQLKALYDERIFRVKAFQDAITELHIYEREIRERLNDKRYR